MEIMVWIIGREGMMGKCRMGIRDGIRRRRNESTNLKSQGNIITKVVVDEDVGIGVGHHRIHPIIHHLHRYHHGVEGIMIVENIIGKIDMNQGTAEVEVEVLIGITVEEMTEEGSITAGIVEAEAGVIVQGIDAVGTPLDHIVGVEVGMTQVIGGNMTVTGGRGDVMITMATTTTTIVSRHLTRHPQIINVPKMIILTQRKRRKDTA